MDKELMDEINYEIQILIKIGFYSDDEILEIIDEEFGKMLVDNPDLKIQFMSLLLQLMML
ncbi:MAG: hypothetical protein J6O99_06330 [Methanobrevibacter sp.]|nr:hypothetical protein [Methanobrevibacter sp.]